MSRPGPALAAVPGARPAPPGPAGPRPSPLELLAIVDLLARQIARELGAAGAAQQVVPQQMTQQQRSEP